MPELGSPAWIDALARSVEPLDAGGIVLTVRHRIEGGPGWLVIADGDRVTATPVTHGDAGDVSFTWQRGDAEAVAAGTTSALAVFQAGRLRVGGDLRRLTEATTLFARFPGVPA